MLTAIEDMAVPDPAMSAKLVALLPRMRVVEATQKGQAAEVAELRARSEQVIKGWYGRGVVDYGEFVADVEGRVGRVETSVRRAEKLRDDTV